MLESKFNVETKVVVVDFTGGKEIYAEIRPQLTGLDIGVLGECECVCVCACMCMRGTVYIHVCLSFTVNNVGMSADYPEYFADISSDVRHCCKWT